MFDFVRKAMHNVSTDKIGKRDPSFARAKIISFLCLSIGILLVLMFTVSLFILVCDNPFSVWLDEAWDIDACKQSLKGTIEMILADGIPPLDLVLRKTFAYLFTSSVFSMKVLSIVPTILMMFCMLFFLRKEFSDKVAIIFLLSVCASPAIVHYSVEIRGYALVLAFVTMLIPTGWYIIKTGKLKWWLLFLLMAVCAGYTHAYGSFNAAIVYCFLLGYWLLKKDKKQIKIAIFVAFLGVLLYSPWIPVTLEKFSQVSKDFWIGPITKHDVIGFLQFPFSMRYGGGYFGKVFYSWLFICSLFIFLGKFVKGERDKKSLFALCGLVSAILLLFLGLAVSFLARPLIIDRYIFCSIGLVFFFFAVVMGSLRSAKLYAMLIVAMLMFSTYNVWTKHKKECEENVRTMQFINFLNDNISSDDVIVFFKDKCLCGYCHYPRIFKHFLPNNRQMQIRYEEFLALKEQPEVFWIIEHCEGPEVSCYKDAKFYGRFSEDWYWFNIYGSKLGI